MFESDIETTHGFDEVSESEVSVRLVAFQTSAASVPKDVRVRVLELQTFPGIEVMAEASWATIEEEAVFVLAFTSATTEEEALLSAVFVLVLTFVVSLAVAVLVLPFTTAASEEEAVRISDWRASGLPPTSAEVRERPAPLT